MKEKALRFNENKPKYQLLEPVSEREEVKVYSKGAEKYEDDNWKKGQSFRSSIGSLKRHISKFEMGEDFDHDFDKKSTDKWGLTHHLAHISWQAKTLLWQYYNARENDDRCQRLKQNVGLDIDGVVADFQTSFLDYMFNTGKISQKEREAPLHHWNDYRFRDNFKYIADSEEFWSNIKPLLHGSELKFEPECYITARTIDKNITEKWLKNNGFPVKEVINVGFDGDKRQALKDHRIEIFIEDRFENYLDARELGIFCYMVNRPHNMKYDIPDFNRIDSIKEIDYSGKKL